MQLPRHRRDRNATGALCLLLVATLAQSQRLAYLQHQSWSTDAGLPQSSVHQILQSHDGYLWLATEGGVVRYDGVVFKVYNHANDPSFTSDDVSALAEDRQGNLWFGTADGVIESAHGHTRHFGEAEGLPSASVIALKVTKVGAPIVVTTLGAASFDGSRFQSLGSSEVEQETTSHGSTNGVAWSWDQHRVTAQRIGETLSWRTGTELPGSRVQTVLLDRSGVAWVGTNRGLVTLSATDKYAQPVTALGVESVLALTEDAEGDLWIGTETSGLHALRPRAFRTEPLLASDEICCVVAASDGTIWLGTREDGLRHLRRDASGSSVLFSAPNTALTSPVILSLAAGLHGDVWTGTPDGLNHIEAGGKVTLYTSANGLPDGPGPLSAGHARWKRVDRHTRRPRTPSRRPLRHTHRGRWSRRQPDRHTLPDADCRCRRPLGRDAARPLPVARRQHHKLRQRRGVDLQSHHGARNGRGWASVGCEP